MYPEVFAGYPLVRLQAWRCLSDSQRGHYTPVKFNFNMLWKDNIYSMNMNPADSFANGFRERSNCHFIVLWPVLGPLPVYTQFQ
jgi:hypothetical protein